MPFFRQACHIEVVLSASSLLGEPVQCGEHQELNQVRRLSLKGRLTPYPAILVVRIEERPHSEPSHLGLAFNHGHSR